MPIKVTSKNISQRPKKPIEYKKIDVKGLENKGYNVKNLSIELDDEGYFSKFSPEIKKRDDKEETTVVNVGVGRGKTTAIRELIWHYLEIGLVVIIAAPFKSIVQKYHKDLFNDQEDERYDPAVNEFTFKVENKYIQVVNYQIFETASNADMDRLVKADLHLMSFNCIMRNPSSPALDQKVIKSNYLDKLISHVKANNKKVVIIFDEIHESIHNFSGMYLFHLYKWKNIVLKTFVLSATYTEASILAIQLISYLTNDSLLICNIDRQKFKTQSNLTLVPLQESSYSRLSIQDEIVEYVNHIVANGEQYHILCYSKQLVKDIQEHLKDSANLTLGDNDNNFDPEGNNIGTTFKTGVNITSPQKYFIIPPLHLDNFHDIKRTGIFFDGIPSIIQAFARMRDGGEIFVFIKKPNEFIKDDYKTIEEDWLHDSLYLGGMTLGGKFILCPSSRKLLEKQLDIIKRNYQSKFSSIELIIQAYNAHIEKTSKPKLTYPTLDDFILNYSQEYLVANYKEYGKQIIPYILWAAYYNQFTNCTLTKVDFIHEDVEVVDFDTNTLDERIKEMVEQYDSDDIMKNYTEFIKHLSKRDGKRIQLKIDGNYKKLKQFLSEYQGTIFKHLVGQNQVRNKNENSSVPNYKDHKFLFLNDFINYRISQIGSNGDLDDNYRTLNEKLQLIETKIGEGNTHFSEAYLREIDPKFYTDLKPVLRNIYRIEKEKTKIYLEAIKQSKFDTDRIIFNFIKELFDYKTNQRFPQKYAELKGKASTIFRKRHDITNW